MTMTKEYETILEKLNLPCDVETCLLCCFRELEDNLIGPDPYRTQGQIEGCLSALALTGYISDDDAEELGNIANDLVNRPLSCSEELPF